MATQFTSNSRSISMTVYTAFNPVTGASGTIDTIIAALDGRCSYIGGELVVGGRPIKDSDMVGVYLDTEDPVALTPVEIEAGWTED
jgi:hypothetical protein